MQPGVRQTGPFLDVIVLETKGKKSFRAHTAMWGRATKSHRQPRMICLWVPWWRAHGGIWAENLTACVTKVKPAKVTLWAEEKNTQRTLLLLLANTFLFKRQKKCPLTSVSGEKKSSRSRGAWLKWGTWCSQWLMWLEPLPPSEGSL